MAVNSGYNPSQPRGEQALPVILGVGRQEPTKNTHLKVNSAKVALETRVCGGNVLPDAGERPRPARVHPLSSLLCRHWPMQEAVGNGS